MPPRRPNFVAFIMTGAIIGFAIGGWIAISRPEAPAGPAGSYSGTSAVGYLGLGLAILGGVLAALVAVITDLVRQRKFNSNR